jgi:hypothetical protein
MMREIAGMRRKAAVRLQLIATVPRKTVILHHDFSQLTGKAEFDFLIADNTLKIGPHNNELH